VWSICSIKIFKKLSHLYLVARHQFMYMVQHYTGTCICNFAPSGLADGLPLSTKVVQEYLIFRRSK
jgi:hypothetical protein